MRNERENPGLPSSNSTRGRVEFLRRVECNKLTLVRTDMGAFWDRAFYLRIAFVYFIVVRSVSFCFVREVSLSWSVGRIAVTVLSVIAAWCHYLICVCSDCLAYDVHSWFGIQRNDRSNCSCFSGERDRERNLEPRNTNLCLLLLPLTLPSLSSPHSPSGCPTPTIPPSLTMKGRKTLHLHPALPLT